MLGTDAFLSLARAAAMKYGLPHLAVALVPHPIGGIDPKLVRAKAETIVDEVLGALTRDPAPPAPSSSASTEPPPPTTSAAPSPPDSAPSSCSPAMSRARNR